MSSRTALGPLACVLSVLLLGATPSASEEANAEDGVKITLDRKGLGFESEDGAFSIKIGARLHFDAAGHIGNLPRDFAPGAPFVPTTKADPTDGVEIRRGRIQLSGEMYRDWA